MKIRFSMGAISAGTFAEMCGGTLRDGRGAELRIRAICTDSGEADGETVFTALRGEREDGHNYIANAIANGCRCILCEHSCDAIEQAGAAAVVVNNTELALSYFANACRHALTCHTIAVTGSVGKTTTKDMIWAVLSEKHKTYRTPGNHNSLIGMPLSVSEIPADTAWAVLEMGMSAFGEVERLSVAAEPDFAIITNIGTAHMEALGSRENICRAKLEVLCGLRTGGTLLLNGDEPLLRGIGGTGYRTVYVSLDNAKADFRARNIRVEESRTLFDLSWEGGEERDLCVNVMGKHNVYAALFAFAIGTMSGMKPEEIRRGLERFVPEGLRQRMTDLGTLTLIEDCYNASPESMTASVEVLQDFCRQTDRRSVAVLGDMLELGGQSPALHRRVGAHLAYLGVEQLITVGPMSLQIAAGARQMGLNPEAIHSFYDWSDITPVVETLKEILLDGDVVLFKASRAVGEERIIEALKRETASVNP